MAVRQGSKAQKTTRDGGNIAARQRWRAAIGTSAGRLLGLVVPSTFRNRLRMCGAHRGACVLRREGRRIHIRQDVSERNRNILRRG